MFDKNQPLWLPSGSVRAILALLIIIPIMFISLRSDVKLTGDQVMGFASLVLTAYFVAKASKTS